MNRIWVLTLVICITSCQGGQSSIPTAVPTQTVRAPTHTPLPTSTRTAIPRKTGTPAPSPTASTAQAKLIIQTPTPLSEEWKDLPVLPVADSSVRDIYENGLLLGNDPHAFSIFGDCQSRPDDFFGVFETDPIIIESLAPELREAVNNFDGSFNRESPTSQDGTTPGALLWDQWHRGEYGCTFAETPVQCELRIHRPSFVIIQIGTHFESRNTEYLRDIINQLIDAGVVPILATKADNRELDNRVNRDMALLAAEFDLPLWNFWAALSDLPDRGLYVMDGREDQGAVYLNDEAAERHRMTGLAALNAVWRVAIGQ